LSISVGGFKKLWLALALSRHGHVAFACGNRQSGFKTRNVALCLAEIAACFASACLRFAEVTV
jgi:hypothetical protein